MYFYTFNPQLSKSISVFLYLCNQMTQNKESQYEVMRRVRLPLIILVTYAHSYGAIREGYSMLGSGWDTYEILKILVSQTLVKVAVPAFFVMSGYLFFANVERFTKKVYWQKIKRRIKSLLIPYIIWNLLMAAKLGEISMNTFIAPANMPLWFLRDLIIVSLATPIIYIGVRKLGWWIVAILLPIYVTGMWAIQPEANPYAICFFCLGAALSIKKMDLVETCGRYVMPACVLSVILIIAMMLTYGSNAYMGLMLMFRVTSVVMLFGLAGIAHRGQSLCNPLRFSQEGQSPMCDFGAEASYFVYLAHYVLFFGFIDTTFFEIFGDSTASLCAHYLICPLIKATILIAIYWLYRIIRSKTTDRLSRRTTVSIR